jgi:BspA type Leucine rich repeat region (6 copies)
MKSRTLHYFCWVFFAAFAAQAQFKYTTNNGAITITRYTGSDGMVAVPNSLDGFPVTTIGGSAFASTGVGSVVLPNSITNIGYEAFVSCANLTNVTIPSSVLQVQNFAFLGCPLLANIAVDPHNAFYSSVDGVLFDKNQTVLMQCPETKTGTYTVPDTVSTIGSEAFYGCGNLTNVMLGRSVSSVSTGGGDMFFNCTHLVAITVNTNNPFFTGIDGVLFKKDGSVLVLYPFGRAGTYTIPNGAASIGYAAFYYRQGLTGVTMPASLTDITDGAFSSCGALAAFNVDGNNAVFSSLDGVLFDKAQSTLLLFPPAHPAAAYTVPGGVKNIHDNAFIDCEGLTSVTLGGGVTNIGGYAFLNCNNVTAFFFPGSPPSADSTAFTGDSGAKAYYLPGATGWGATYDGLPTAPGTLPYPVIVKSGLEAGGMSLTVSWLTNLPVVVEAATTLVKPTWQPLQTNVPSNGTFVVSDPNWNHQPVRFYRARTP